MPKWEYRLTVINNTDRDLELVSFDIPWGRKDNIPQSISAGGTGEFKAHAPAGTATGLEFYFTMRDKAPENQSHYGDFSVAVDIPYWKHANKGSIECHGILKQEGFEKTPDGAHDFATTTTISTSLFSNQNRMLGDSADSVDESCNLYDWDSLQNQKIVDPDETSIYDFVPDKNIMKARTLVGRTDSISVPRCLWEQINDRKCPDPYSKANYVKDYFTVAAYELRKNKTVPIAANQSYTKTIEISNRSTVRRETRQELLLENTIEAGGEGEGFSLRDTLRTQYQISQLDEYCEEDMKTVREEFNYDATDQDRDVVLWDLAEILALYRIDISGQIELVGVDDYYLESTQITYSKTDTTQDKLSNGDLQAENIDDPEEDEWTETCNGAEVLADMVTTIQGNATINGIHYRWMEWKSGTNRGMLFNPNNHVYKFRPNPHDDRQYSKQTVRWYTDMAKQFEHAGNAGHWTSNNWPNSVTNLHVNGINYTADVR